MAFKDEVKAEAGKMMSGYGIGNLIAKIKFGTRMEETTLGKDLEEIAEAIVLSAATARLNAAYGGSHDDGGAGRQMDKLKGYLEGVLTGVTCTIVEGSAYAHTFKTIQQQRDPEYAKYLELKAKFGDK